MNWFMLLLILKLFTNIWAAPIDLLEAKDELQNVSNDFISNNFNITDQANNLLKSTEEVINSTASQLSENLSENAQKISDNLDSFAAEIGKVVELSVEKATTETVSETTPAKEENTDQVSSILSPNMIVTPEEIKHEEISLTTQTPVETATEYVEKVLLDSDNSSSDNVMPAEAEYRNNDRSEPAVTENVFNDFKPSPEVETVQEDISSPVNEDSLRESVEISENKTIEDSENKSEQNLDISITSNAPETEQVSANSDNNVEQTTHESKPEVTTSIPQTLLENLNENVEQIYNLSEKLIENVAHKTIEATGNVEQLASSFSNVDSTTASNLEETLSPITPKVEEEEMASNINSNNNDKPTLMDETTTNNPETTSNETPALEEAPVLKETVDSFINHVSDIGSDIGKAAEELRFDASMIHAATENFVNPDRPLVMQENMTEIEQPTAVEHEDMSEQAPTFKEAVDSFIDEVVEIGSKLGLIPEEKPVEELPTTTEPLSEIINIETTPPADIKENESNASTPNFEQSLDALVGKLDKIAGNLDDNQTDSPVMHEEVKSEEIIMTTTPSLENLTENQNNISEVVENSETSNFGRSVETLIEAASEIGGNFGNAVSNLFSSNENKQESVMETTTPAEQTISDISATEVPVQMTTDENTKSLMVDQENIEVSSTTPTQNESFSYATEGIAQTINEHQETIEGNPQESQDFTSQVLQENQHGIETENEEQSAKYAEYIPVAVITIPEPEFESTKPTEHSETPQQLIKETESVSEQEPQASQGEETSTESKQPEFIETSTKEEHSLTNEEKESENLTEDSASKTEEYTTLSPMLHETTTPNSVPVFDETTHALNKFENTLKTLIEQEKLKHEERHATSLETNQQETTTLAPISKSPITTHQEEPATTTTTTQSLEETTMLPKKFEEELQMAVKALEETTHHHFEEFQNNLKEAFKKFTVWGADHERPEATTTTATILKTELNEETTTETGTTQQILSEQPTTMMPEVEVSQDKINVVVEESAKTEEPHRSGVINENFIDKFADNYEESSVATATEMQMEKQEVSQKISEEYMIEKEQTTTESPIDVTTTMLPVEEEIKSVPQEQDKLNTDKSFVEVTTMYNDVKEDLAPTAENIVKESTGESQEMTTEYIAETTITPLLARVTLYKVLNSVSLIQDNEHNTVSPIEETTVQNLDSEQMKVVQPTESTQTTEAMVEITTQPTPETAQKEMVTFIEHNDNTTAKQQQEDEESSVTTMQTMTTQTQEPLTQASFMEEQQQQLESTTEHDAQTQTAAASGQTATTTTTVQIEDGDDDDTLQQETTETDIHSSTVVEEDEMATTTVEPIAASVEPEARSLSLPPPKLEYLQNEDGVEVFYGYSIVKHN